MEIGSQEWLQAKSTGPHWSWTDSTGIVRQGYMQQFSDRGGTDVTYYMRRYDNDLYSLAIACETNAINLCNVQGWEDQRNALRERLVRICKKHDVALVADVTGDPRGYCLKLHLPDASYNTWGGKETGYGIGSN